MFPGNVNSLLFFRQPPSIVRLGDQNLKTENDGAQPVDYDIKRFIKHGSYNRLSRENDIALIELESTITFTKFIRPACLQQGNQISYQVVAVRDQAQTSANSYDSNFLQRLAGGKIQLSEGQSMSFKR
jgi:hypothetical protein